MPKDELKKKIEETSDLQEKYELQKQLIDLIKKEIRLTKDKSTIAFSKKELLDETNKSKEMLQAMQKEEGIPISRKLGLKIKEIATTIKIFCQKHDVIEKAKTIGFSTAVGTAISAAIAAGLSLVGVGALPTLASLFPTMCYIGLSNIIRMPFTDTQFTKYLKAINGMPPEEKEKLNSFIVNKVNNNEKLIELCKRKLAAKDRNEVIKINKEILDEYNNLLKESSFEQVDRVLTFEKINILEENKELYESIKKDFIKDKVEMSNSEFLELEKNLLLTSTMLTKENSYVKEVLKETGKGMMVDLLSMFGARSILGAVGIPGMTITSINDAIIPLIYVGMNAINKSGNIRKGYRLMREQYEQMKGVMTSVNNTEERSLKVA